MQAEGQSHSSPPCSQVASIPHIYTSLTPHSLLLTDYIYPSLPHPPLTSTDYIYPSLPHPPLTTTDYRA